jgi:hypothetical protein
MAETGNFPTPPLQAWQRANVVAAANLLREQLVRDPEDAKLRAAYEGLLELLDPSRIVARRQREMAEATKQAAAAIKYERRRGERRRADRRIVDLGPPGPERRSGTDRRTGRDRRKTGS